MKREASQMRDVVQASLWDSPTVPFVSWLGCTVLYHGRERGQVTKILAVTKQWGTLYECQIDGQAYPVVAYADELVRMLA